jgi:hypothetical protein
MKHQLSFRLLLLLLVTSALASCESTTENPPDNSVIKKPSLLVLNEGALGGFNASLDVIKAGSGERQENILPNLGDVGSDVEIIDGKIYVVSSNSRRLYAIDPVEGKTLASYTFEKPSSPNAIAKINDNEALVTHLYWNRLDVIDLTTNTVKDSIRVGQGTVDIVTMNGFAYVTASSGYLYVVDLTQKKLVDSIMIGDIPQRVLPDPTRNQLVTLSWGIWQVGTANVSIIDVATRTVKRKTEVASSVQKLVAGDNKFYIIYSDKVETMDPVSGIAVGLATTGYLGGVYDAPANELYVGSGDWTNPGKVDVLDGSNGTLKRTYNAGIAPTHFAFYR